MIGDLVGPMPKHPVVLAACPSFALPTLEKVLGSYVTLLHATSLAGATSALSTDARISMIVCGVHFDDSRMYELLRYARREFPHTPFVCVRVSRMEIPRITLDALRMAAESLGATFIDLPGLVDALGSAWAELEMRSRLLASIRPESRSA